MWCLRLAILFIFFPLVLSAQHAVYDTLSPFDTIPPGTRMLKGAGDFTFETVVDSANTLVINEFLASNSGFFWTFGSGTSFHQGRASRNRNNLLFQTGHMFLGETRIEQGKIYDPSDLIFSPQEPFSSSSSLVYSFIDNSGQESTDNTIQFNPAVNVKPGIQPGFLLYPVPAKEFCMIEIPPDHLGPIDFFLFDLNGKTLQSLHLINPGSKLTVDLTGVESGIYLYLIRTRQAVVNGKIEVIK